MINEDEVRLHGPRWCRFGWKTRTDDVFRTLTFSVMVGRSVATIRLRRVQPDINIVP